MDIVPKWFVFNIKSTNEEMENEFHAFFYKYNLTELFNDEHLATQISVSDNELRSVVNDGKASQIFKKFADYLTIGNDNKSYEEAIFRIIKESRSLRGMTNKLSELMEYIQTMDQQYLHNTWNIVWYNKDLK